MALTTEEYIQSLPAERREPFAKLLAVIRKKMPAGFQEIMHSSPMFIVPLSAFPAGYHCTPGKPLGFLSLVSTKGFIALHHFGIYMNPPLYQWFVEQYQLETQSKPDMGKSCIRFRKLDRIPFRLIGDLVARQSMEEYLARYQTALQRRPMQR